MDNLAFPKPIKDYDYLMIGWVARGMSIVNIQHPHITFRFLAFMKVEKVLSHTDIQLRGQAIEMSTPKEGEQKAKCREYKIQLIREVRIHRDQWKKETEVLVPTSADLIRLGVRKDERSPGRLITTRAKNRGLFFKGCIDPYPEWLKFHLIKTDDQDGWDLARILMSTQDHVANTFVPTILTLLPLLPKF